MRVGAHNYRMDISTESMSRLQRFTRLSGHYLLLWFFALMACPQVVYAEIQPDTITVFAAASLRDAVGTGAQLALFQR